MQNQTSSVVARVEGVRKLYGSTPPVVALDDVTLSIERGEFTAVMGPSGSGKSTLMHVLAGLDTASAGRVFLGDVEITAMGDAELTVLRRRSVGFVFQAFNLVPTLDVRGNIRLPFELDGRRVTAEEEEWIARLIESLGLRERLTHRPHELSGGQQQRVAIARALATRPQLIFADEPTGNLDSRTGREVLSLLRASTREYGQSIAMVTHDPIAAAFADRIVFLRDGAVVDDRRGMSAEEISRAMLSMEGAS
ncbi:MULTISPECIES: ABC transporter ATP-binding protein [Rathayibacter]|jgi:putative ABC transport system ATP-binding protein|uniref:Peptide ABC transporter ATP-binding protein n=2 Tax=Rathayibacter festucae TaxID=110937 RepID=A0A3Q9V1H8_9MICO|nr:MULTISPECIES: ABC transporter ATP-binding protein [Rathayibacter]AZZ53314.1 peptide ABC transporter ATP-binding protein [Rathayibacter festucae DSM 15932]MCJ1673467.1 ABC transporter ATP-binding protein [Rathayibacter sp. VKM Ac-2929]MCJ1698152.1 ABC transporter ATP-binding protein [Rathayibacter festucae]MCJ1703063.1 ABC transporter ATP-binding protein [Rathayibacter sp. VKM Ac-2926]MDY0911831.1 ABC transporter ATP-binding protein [Rathayibacter festucae]